MRSIIQMNITLLGLIISPNTAAGQQKRLTELETQHVYSLIRQTKEYKTLDAQKNSFNNAQAENAVLKERT